MPSTLGIPTTSPFLNEAEGDKIHLEFTVKTAVKAGMPVELFTNGTVQPVTPGTASLTGIGVALQDRAADELVTVACRGFAVVNGEAKAASNAGPAVWDSFNATTGLNVYDDGGAAATLVGWVLDAATDSGDLVRVLVY